MAQEFMYLPNNSASKQGYSLSDPLGGFIAEVESGAGLQVPDAAAVRYERLCTEAQLDIDKEVPAAAGCHLYRRFAGLYLRQFQCLDR